MSHAELVERAREAALKLLCGPKVGDGDGQTYIARLPSVDDLATAMIAFASTERAGDAGVASQSGASVVLVPCNNCGQPAATFLPMDKWDKRDEAVLLLVDYRDHGDHAIDDATVAVTIGHNNDHNVGDDEGQGWLFAGWCWSHDHYVQGKGKPIGWLPLSEYHQAARRIENAMDGVS